MFKSSIKIELNVQNVGIFGDNDKKKNLIRKKVCGLSAMNSFSMKSLIEQKGEIQSFLR